MKTVKIEKSGGGGGTWKVQVDAKTVKDDEIDVDVGIHKLKWFVTAGQPGAKYTIAIVEPASAKTKIEGKLVSTGQTSGTKTFEVK